MEVILNKDVEKIGKAGAVVRVKEGFARNFLFPHNLAQPATAGSLKKLEQVQQLKSAQLNKIKEEMIQVKNRLSGLALTISALTQGEEKLYGSINAQDISEALKEEGFTIDKNMIDLVEPIKSLGIYEVSVKLHPEVVATIKLWVVRK
jgi:large subunit ribosomal protein L9